MTDGKAHLLRQLDGDAARVFVATHPELEPAFAELNPSSLVELPLWTSPERVLGSIIFLKMADSEPYQESDLEFIEEFSHRCALGLENAQLYESAREAIQVRDEFLSVASHELRTPLTPLQLQIDNLHLLLQESGVLNDRLSGQLEMARKQTRRLSKLVESLLDVSRLSSGRLRLDLEYLDLAQLAEDVVQRFRLDAERSGSQLHLDAAGPVIGKWDRLRMEQILSNFLANAIKYGAGQPIEIGVFTKNRLAQLTVRDRGIGIAPEDVARIFGCFERAASVRHYGGLGLGLFISRQLVEAHGGSISVQSEPGAGATFTIIIPLEPTKNGAALQSLGPSGVARA
jgi:signal transduction histidine kinase